MPLWQSRSQIVPVERRSALLHLVDVSDILYFFLLGEGEGGVRGARGGGSGFSLKFQEGGFPGEEGGLPRGREGVRGEFGGGGGG